MVEGLKRLLARLLGLGPRRGRKPFSIIDRDGVEHRFNHRRKRARAAKRYVRGLLLPCLALMSVCAWGASIPTVETTPQRNSAQHPFWVVGASSITVNPGTGVWNSSYTTVVSPGNSTSVLLGSGGVFTGTGEDVKDFSTIVIAAYADQASAANGLAIQFSTSNVTWTTQHSFSLSAGERKHFHFDPHTRYFRIVYTNGAVAQGSFYIQAYYHPTLTYPAHTAFSDTVQAEDLAVLTRSVITGQSTAGGTSFVNVKVSPAGAVQIGGDVNVATTGGASVVVKSSGTFTYESATLTSGSLAGVGRCSSIKVVNTSAISNASYNINGGDTVTLPGGIGLDHPIGETLTAPTVNWVSGSISVVIEGFQ